MPVVQWITPVTDRSQSDVDRVIELYETGWSNLTDEQKVDWLSGLKGCLNASDLNRIENNIQLLILVLELSLTTYYESLPDIPDVTYFETLLSNTEIIREAYCIHTDTPAVPDWPPNEYQKINDIEKILLDVYEILSNNFFHYSSDETGIYAGDETGLLL